MADRRNLSRSRRKLGRSEAGDLERWFAACSGYHPRSPVIDIGANLTSKSFQRDLPAVL